MDKENFQITEVRVNELITPKSDESKIRIYFDIDILLQESFELSVPGDFKVVVTHIKCTTINMFDLAVGLSFKYGDETNIFDHLPLSEDDQKACLSAIKKIGISVWTD